MGIFMVDTPNKPLKSHNPITQDDQGRHEVGMVENTVKTPLGINQEGCLFEAR